MGALGTIAKLTVHMVADRSQFVKQLELAGSDVTKFGAKSAKSMSGLNKLQAGSAAGFGALTGTIASSVKIFQEYGQGVKAIDRATQAGAAKSSLMNAQFKRFAVTGNEAKMGLRTLSLVLTRLKYGTESAQKAAAKKFELAGVDAATVKTMDLYDAAYYVREEMSKLTDAARRSATSVLLFGRTGMKLLPWLEMDAKEIGDLNKVIEESGMVWTDKQFKDWYKMMTMWRVAQIRLIGLQITIANDVMPWLERLSKLANFLMSAFWGLGGAIVPLTGLLGMFAGFGFLIKGAGEAVVFLSKLSGSLSKILAQMLGIRAAEGAGFFSKASAGVKAFTTTINAGMGKLKTWASAVAAAFSGSWGGSGGGAAGGIIGGNAVKAQKAAAKAAAAAAKVAAKEAQILAAKSAATSTLAYSAGGNIFNKQMAAKFSQAVTTAGQKALAGIWLAENGIRAMGVLVRRFGAYLLVKIIAAWAWGSGLGSAIGAFLKIFGAKLAATIAAAFVTGGAVSNLIGGAKGLGPKLLGAIGLGSVARGGGGLLGRILFGAAATAGVGGIFGVISSKAAASAASVKTSLQEIGSAQRKALTVTFSRSPSERVPREGAKMVAKTASAARMRAAGFDESQIKLAVASFNKLAERAQHAREAEAVAVAQWGETSDRGVAAAERTIAAQTAVRRAEEDIVAAVHTRLAATESTTASVTKMAQAEETLTAATKRGTTVAKATRVRTARVSPVVTSYIPGSASDPTVKAAKASSASSIREFLGGQDDLAAELRKARLTPVPGSASDPAVQAARASAEGAAQVTAKVQQKMYSAEEIASARRAVERAHEAKKYIVDYAGWWTTGEEGSVLGDAQKTFIKSLREGWRSYYDTRSSGGGGSGVPSQSLAGLDGVKSRLMSIQDLQGDLLNDTKFFYDYVNKKIIMFDNRPLQTSMYHGQVWGHYARSLGEQADTARMQLIELEDTLMTLDNFNKPLEKTLTINFLGDGKNLESRAVEVANILSGLGDEASSWKLNTGWDAKPIWALRTTMAKTAPEVYDFTEYLNVRLAEIIKRTGEVVDSVHDIDAAFSDAGRLYKLGDIVSGDVGGEKRLALTIEYFNQLMDRAEETRRALNGVGEAIYYVETDVLSLQKVIVSNAMTARQTNGFILWSQEMSVASAQLNNFVEDGIFNMNRAAEAAAGTRHATASAVMADAAAMHTTAAEASAVLNGLTEEAQALLKSVDAGGVPAYMTNNLRRIAEANDIVVTSAMTPNEVIASLQEMAAMVAEDTDAVHHLSVAFEETASAVEHVSAASSNLSKLDKFVRSLQDMVPSQALGIVEDRLLRARNAARLLMEAGKQGSATFREYANVIRVLQVEQHKFAFETERLKQAGMTRTERKAYLEAKHAELQGELRGQTAVERAAERVRVTTAETAAVTEHVGQATAVAEENMGRLAATSAHTADSARDVAASLEVVSEASAHAAENARTLVASFDIIPEFVTGAATELQSMDAFLARLEYTAKNLNFTNMGNAIDDLRRSFAGVDFLPTRANTLAVFKAMRQDYVTALTGAGVNLEKAFQPLKGQTLLKMDPIDMGPVVKSFTELDGAITGSQAWENMRNWGDDLTITRKQIDQLSKTLAGFNSTRISEKTGLPINETVGKTSTRLFTAARQQRYRALVRQLEEQIASGLVEVAEAPQKALEIAEEAGRWGARPKAQSAEYFAARIETYLGLVVDQERIAALDMERFWGIAAKSSEGAIKAAFTDIANMEFSTPAVEKLAKLMGITGQQLEAVVAPAHEVAAEVHAVAEAAQQAAAPVHAAAAETHAVAEAAHAATSSVHEVAAEVAAVADAAQHAATPVHEVSEGVHAVASGAHGATASVHGVAVEIHTVAEAAHAAAPPVEHVVASMESLVDAGHHLGGSGGPAAALNAIDLSGVKHLQVAFSDTDIAIRSLSPAGIDAVRQSVVALERAASATGVESLGRYVNFAQKSAKAAQILAAAQAVAGEGDWRRFNTAGMAAEEYGKRAIAAHNALLDMGYAENTLRANLQQSAVVRASLNAQVERTTAAYNKAAGASARFASTEEKSAKYLATLERAQDRRVAGMGRAATAAVNAERARVSQAAAWAYHLEQISRRMETANAAAALYIQRADDVEKALSRVNRSLTIMANNPYAHGAVLKALGEGDEARRAVLGLSRANLALKELTGSSAASSQVLANTMNAAARSKSLLAANAFAVVDYAKRVNIAEKALWKMAYAEAALRDNAKLSAAARANLVKKPLTSAQLTKRLEKATAEYNKALRSVERAPAAATTSTRLILEVGGTNKVVDAANTIRDIRLSMQEAAKSAGELGTHTNFYAQKLSSELEPIIKVLDVVPEKTSKALAVFNKSNAASKQVASSLYAISEQERLAADNAAKFAAKESAISGIQKAYNEVFSALEKLNGNLDTINAKIRANVITPAFDETELTKGLTTTTAAIEKAKLQLKSLQTLAASEHITLVTDGGEESTSTIGKLFSKGKASKVGEDAGKVINKSIVNTVAKSTLMGSALETTGARGGALAGEAAARELELALHELTRVGESQGTSFGKSLWRGLSRVLVTGKKGVVATGVAEAFAQIAMQLTMTVEEMNNIVDDADSMSYSQNAWMAGAATDSWKRFQLGYIKATNTALLGIPNAITQERQEAMLTKAIKGNPELTKFFVAPAGGGKGLGASTSLLYVKEFAKNLANINNIPLGDQLAYVNEQITISTQKMSTLLPYWEKLRIRVLAGESVMGSYTMMENASPDDIKRAAQKTFDDYNAAAEVALQNSRINDITFQVWQGTGKKAAEGFQTGFLNFPKFDPAETARQNQQAALDKQYRADLAAERTFKNFSTPASSRAGVGAVQRQQEALSKKSVEIGGKKFASTSFNKYVAGLTKEIIRLNGVTGPKDTKSLTAYQKQLSDLGESTKFSPKLKSAVDAANKAIKEAGKAIDFGAVMSTTTDKSMFGDIKFWTKDFGDVLEDMKNKVKGKGLDKTLQFEAAVQLRINGAQTAKELNDIFKRIEEEKPDITVFRPEEVTATTINAARFTAELQANFDKLQLKPNDEGLKHAVETDRTIIQGMIDTATNPALAASLQQTLDYYGDIGDSAQTVADKQAAINKEVADAATQLNGQKIVFDNWMNSMHKFEIELPGDGIQTVETTGRNLAASGKATIDDVTKTYQLVAGVTQLADDAKSSQAELVSANADLAETLTNIPRDLIKILKSRDWAAIGAAIIAAGQEFVSAWNGMTAEAQTALVDSASNLNSIAGAMGAVLTTFAEMPKKAIKPVQQNWGAFGKYMAAALAEVSKSFKDEWLTINEQRATLISSIAGSLGTFIQALADMPKKGISMVRQNWTALGEAVKFALGKLLNVFAGMDLGPKSEKSALVAGIAGDVGSFISAIADMPKAAVGFRSQSFTSLAQSMKMAMLAILDVFSSVKGMKSRAEKMGNISSVAGSISSIITAFVDITGSKVGKAVAGLMATRKKSKKLASEMLLTIKAFFDEIKSKGVSVSEEAAGNSDRIFSIISSVSDVINAFSELTSTTINQAVASLKKVKSKTPALGAAMVGVVKALQHELSGLKVTEEFSGTSDRVLSMVGSIGDTINAYAEITQDMISSAVTNLNTTAASSAPLGAAMLNLIKALQAQLKPLLKNESFGAFADITDKVITIANGVAGVITTYAEITKTTITLAVHGLDSAASQAPLIGGAMKRLVQRLQKALENSGVKETSVALVGNISDISNNIAGLLKTYAELTMASISDAVTMMNAAAGQAPQIGLAMVNMALALQAAFSFAGVDAALAKQLEPVQTIVGTMSDILDLISKLSEDGMMAKMTSFLAMNLDALWFGIGQTLVGMMNNLAAALKNIPNAAQFAEAEKALATLNEIFESMTALSGAMIQAPQLAVPGGQGVVPSPVPTGGYPTVPGASQVGGTAQQGKNSTPVEQNFKVEVLWQTYTGEPSEAEKRRMATWLRPTIQKMVDLAARSKLS